VILQEALLKELKNGTLFPIYILLGEDEGAKEEFIEQLRSRLYGREGDSAVSTAFYHGDEALTEEIVETLSTFSFFSEKRLVVVREFEKLKNPTPLNKYLEAPNPEAVLVLLTSKKSLPPAVSTRAEKKGRMSIFWPMFQNQGERWVQAQLEKHGIRAEKDAVQYIIDLSGTNKYELNNQLSFLINYLSSNEVLTIDKAKLIISQLYNYTVFDLSNALFMKPANEIIKIFRYLFNNGEELVKIYYFCVRELTKLLDASALKVRGSDFTDISKALGFGRKEAQRVRNIIERVEYQALRTLLSTAASIDYAIKTSPKELSVVCLERFLAGLGR
jgi:DNA polymerase-3 subunit delta